MNENVTNWMSWRGGVDFMGGFADQEGSMIIVHVAAEVQTPVGSAPAGMVIIQESPNEPPTVFGFISTDQTVADYFGAHIFAGTPFEGAPGLVADIEVNAAGGSDSCSAKISVDGTDIEISLSSLASPIRANREPNAQAPFHQQVIESEAGLISLSINDQSRTAIAAPSTDGAPTAMLSQAGMYSR